MRHNLRKKIGYARCSTDEQNLNLQLDALEAAGCEQVFVDEGVSGAEIEREGLKEALAASACVGGVLVVWKLDRLGRSLSFLIELIDQLGQQNAGFQSLSEAIDTTTAGGKLIFHVMGALAEFERSLIGERTREGMKAAKRRGQHLGRPHLLDAEQIDFIRREIEQNGKSISSMARVFKVDPRTISRALNRAGS